MSAEETEDMNYPPEPQENNNDLPNENSDNNRETTDSLPVQGEAFLSRDSYLDDTFETPKSDKRCIERFCGPVKAGSLRGSVLSLASIVFGICGFTFPIGLMNLGLIPSLILLAILCSICYWSLSALLYAGRKKKILKYGPLIRECLGSKMALISEINNIIFCVGILMGYEFTISTFFMDVYSKFFTVNSDNQNLIKLIQMAVLLIE